MRHVRLSHFMAPQNWSAAAALAKADVVAAKSNRLSKLKEYSAIWRSLKEPLSKLSHNKCFYCETIRVRDDFEVDHFRPKSARSSDGHQGYWWLAFEQTNFRFSCRFCNQRRLGLDGDEAGGKSSEFPLLPGGIRAREPTDSLDDEFPALLDPARAEDVILIGFNDLGVARPQASARLELVEFERARVSIRIYNLNHGYLRRRREQKALIIKRLIAEVTLQISIHIRRLGQGNKLAALDALKRANQLMMVLNAMRSAKEEYSSLTTHMLLASQADRPWVTRLLALPVDT